MYRWCRNFQSIEFWCRWFATENASGLWKSCYSSSSGSSSGNGRGCCCCCCCCCMSISSSSSTSSGLNVILFSYAFYLGLPVTGIGHVTDTYLMFTVGVLVLRSWSLICVNLQRQQKGKPTRKSPWNQDVSLTVDLALVTEWLLWRQELTRKIR